MTNKEINTKLMKLEREQNILYYHIKVEIKRLRIKQNTIVSNSRTYDLNAKDQAKYDKLEERINKLYVLTEVYLNVDYEDNLLEEK